MENKRRGRPHFFMQGNYWFFGDGRSSPLGPFDRIYEVVMGECVLGDWKCEYRELTGSAVEDALATLS